ncbi:EAL domain-containing protein [Methylobacterium sp. NEAU 140]|uniref:putative bifunctional diguanylate cyclase/phosphodiesterase n=1 Tax=Methylobacterium sp. NEAU 140 TaxID=3064945 RepID=UPI002736FBFE|nr:EAL domain-containing protein [Methylobacterium sp. NEAU 140]MDP4026249.1 EAL domain-containing protein [Methylobacterium sp. NEAU 140]
MQVQRFEIALHHMNQGLCMFDQQARLVVCNHRYREIFAIPADYSLFGKTQEEICGFLVADGRYPSSVTLDMITRSVRSALARPSALPVFRELADGRIIAILYRTIAGGGWVSTFEDITEQRRSQARIQHLARYDGLTDLANARTLREGGQALSATAAKGLPVLACHYLDLDRFKFVNDTYGHAVGDELLQAVAERLRACARREDVVGRLGGDEFALVQRVPGVAAALAFANRLVDEIGVPFELSGGRVEIGVSIGVATHEDRDAASAADVERLLQDADLALRRAKAQERGTVCAFEPAMSEAARGRLTLERDLSAALAAEQIAVHYQPLVESRTGRIIGVEALARWEHPERGFVPPTTFIPLAEEVGLIVPLGAWVLRRACRDAAAWPDHLTVAVNASVVQVRQKSFAESVLAILAETAFPATRLEIEITESTLLEESETTMQNLHRLREAGVRFALDDFGTGYSSLSYLRRFPFDKIKIDRSFMRDAEASTDALAIIRAVAGLGTSLGITTLVEGIETERQFQLARAEGLKQVQGYLFSKPIPSARIAELVAA